MLAASVEGRKLGTRRPPTCHIIGRVGCPTRIVAPVTGLPKRDARPTAEGSAPHADTDPRGGVSFVKSPDKWLPLVVADSGVAGAQLI